MSINNRRLDQPEEKRSNVRLAVYPVAAWREEGVEAVIEEHTGPQFGNCDEQDVVEFRTP